MTLKELREKAGLSQSQLAKKADISVRTIHYYEQGKRDINGAKAIFVYRLAKALNCEMQDLLRTE